MSLSLYFFKNKVRAITALLLTLFIVAISSTYISHGVIIAVEYDYGDCIIFDQAGEARVVSGGDDRACGDTVVMFIWNHFTPSIINDDIILFMR